MTIIKHELYVNRKILYIWTGIIAILIFIMMMIFPDMSEYLDSVNKMADNLGVMAAMFTMDKLDLSTAIGYYGLEVGAMISISGGMFAAIVATGMLSKEEGGHTSEFLYIMPKTRNYFITQKFIALFIIIIIYNAVNFLVTLLSFAVIGESPEIKKLSIYLLSQLIMNLQIGCMCFGISAFLKKNNVGIGIGISILLYFVQLLANITDSVEKLHYITPYYYSDAATAMGDMKIPFVHLCIGILIAVAFTVAGYIYYNKKDLRI